MRIQVDSAGLQQIRSDPQRFEKMVPDLVEAGLGLQIWAGVLQSVERRLGEPLGLEPSLKTPIDWDAAATTLDEAVRRLWDLRTETVLGEIEQEVSLGLPDSGPVAEVVKTRLLVQMSYGQRAFFDRRTHQKRSLAVARLSYPFAAATELAEAEVDELTEQVLDHLASGLAEVQRSLGQSELARQGGAFRELDASLQAGLRETLGEPAVSALEAAPALNAVQGDLRESITAALGRMVMSRGLRGLILAVGDRLWVDYLTQMEALRTSIGLEAYGQRDPLVQYKSRAFDMFQLLMADIRAGVASRLFRAQLPAQPAAAQVALREVELEPAPAPATAPGPDTEPTQSARPKRRRRH